MIELQALESTNSELQTHCMLAQQRIQAIASNHELSYQSDTLSHLNFGETTERIVEKLRDIYGSGKKISLRTQIEPIKLNVNQAIPCGLIINELLTNAYKHAFTDRDDGEIEIRLSEEQTQVQILIKEDGVGVPRGFDYKNVSTIGMTRVKLLKQQLDGELDITNADGTNCSFTFDKTEGKGIGSSIIE